MNGNLLNSNYEQIKSGYRIFIHGFLEQKSDYNNLKSYTHEKI